MKPPGMYFGGSKAMRHFLSHHIANIDSGECFRSTNHLTFCPTPSRNLGVTLLVVCIALLSSSFAQHPFATSHGDSARSAANTNETLLAPSNVNKNSFGRLFSFPVDYVVMAQPLYVPNVNIPGQGTHNVMYVVTQADSAYAVDAATAPHPSHPPLPNIAGTPPTRAY